MRSAQVSFLKPVVLQAAHGNAGERCPKNYKNKMSVCTRRVEVTWPGRLSRFIVEGPGSHQEEEERERISKDEL